MEKLKFGKASVSRLKPQQVTVQGVLGYDVNGKAYYAQLHRAFNERSKCAVHADGADYTGTIVSLTTAHHSNGVEFEAVLAGVKLCPTK